MTICMVVSNLKPGYRIFVQPPPFPSYYITNPMTATTPSIDVTWPAPSWLPEEAATGVVVDPAVSAAAVAPDEEPAVLVAAAAVDDEPEDDVDVAVALEAKPGSS